MEQTVYLQVNNEYMYVGECILDKLSCENSEFINVSYSRSSSVFSISRSKTQKNNFHLPFYHSARCPTQKLANELNKNMKISKKIPIICSILVKSADNLVLITRKSEYMSLFVKS